MKERDGTDSATASPLHGCMAQSLMRRQRCMLNSSVSSAWWRGRKKRVMKKEKIVDADGWTCSTFPAFSGCRLRWDSTNWSTSSRKTARRTCGSSSRVRKYRCVKSVYEAVAHIFFISPETEIPYVVRNGEGAAVSFIDNHISGTVSSYARDPPWRRVLPSRRCFEVSGQQNFPSQSANTPHAEETHRMTFVQWFSYQWVLWVWRQVRHPKCCSSPSEVRYNAKAVHVQGDRAHVISISHRKIQPHIQADNGYPCPIFADTSTHIPSRSIIMMTLF